MKKRLSLIGIIVLLIGLIVGTASITAALYSSSYFDSLNTITSFSIGIISLAISGIALIVSLVTYTSIDSVNSISTMEGNVLENPNYTMAYSELVKKYSHCKTSKELENDIFNNIYYMFKTKSKTCMEFTDCIQSVIDHLLWFAYVDIQDKECQNKIRTLITLLDTRFKKLSALSNGTQYLLQENIKLIRHVLHYQSTRQNTDYLKDRGELYNIRGKLLANPISQTVFYDYLGLEYKAKAVSLLKKYCSFTGDEYLIDNMKLIQDTQLVTDIKDEISFYIRKSKEALNQAAALSDYDLLWEGYIKFNLARVTLLELLTDGCTPDLWKKSIQEAIDARKSVRYLFSEYGDSEHSFILLQFEKEMYYADILNYQYMESTKGLSEREYKKVLKINDMVSNNDTKIYDRIRSYCQDIMKHHTTLLISK